MQHLSFRRTVPGAMEEFVQRFVWALFFLIFAYVTTPAETAAVDFIWNWYPNGSTYTSGTGGDIVYNLYMREGDEADYDYDHPLMIGIDDCVLESGAYTCQISLDYDFIPGIDYYFSVVAYQSANPSLKSAFSNEVLYSDDLSDEEPAVQNSVTEGEGGGCFIDSKVIEFFFGCDTNR